MKTNINLVKKYTGGLALLLALTTKAALPGDWQKEQHFEIASPGLIKLSLPPETRDAARPALEDLRLYDDSGNELPFLIERPVPAGKAVQAAKSFQVSLNNRTTIITLQTGLTQPLDGVTLESPADNFIKAVRVDGSEVLVDKGNSQRETVQVNVGLYDNNNIEIISELEVGEKVLAY